MSIEEWARQEAEKIFSAQRAGIEAQRQAYLDELKRQSDLELQRGRDIAAAIQAMNLPGVVQGIYGTAGESISGLAKGFSGEMQGIANAQAAEQTNMLSGTGQEGAVRNQGENMGNVMYGVQGYNPATTLGTQGAAFASDAALQPAFAMGEAGRRASELYEDGLGGLSDFAMELAKLEGERPLFERELMAERRALRDEEQQRTWAAQDRKQEQLESEREWFLKMAAYYNAIGDDKRAQQYLDLARQREKRMRNSSAGLDANGNPKPGYRTNPKTGRVEKVPTPKKKGSTAAKWGELQQDMADDVEGFVEEVRNPDPYVGGTIEQKIPRAEAYARLWNKYSGLVRNKGRLKRLINQILDRAGFPKPGASKPGGTATANPHLSPQSWR